jgi:periplasmic copper chaperone A
MEDFTMHPAFRSTFRALAFAAAFAPLAAHAQVDVADAWVRGTVAGQKATGAFMTLTSRADAALVGAASPLAKVVEIHEMKLEGSMMRMRAMDRLPLPAGQPVGLTPGGYHVMLMGLADPLKPGDVVPIALTIQDTAGKRSTVEVKATVRPLTSESGAMKH